MAGQEAIRAIEAEAAAAVQPPGPPADVAGGGGGRGGGKKQAAARPAEAAERLLDLEQRLLDLSAQPQPLQAVFNAARVRASRRGASSGGGRAGSLDVLPPDESVRSAAGWTRLLLRYRVSESYCFV